MIPLFAPITAIGSAPPATTIPTAAARSRFQPAAFRLPDSFHWPGHMWIWNDRLDTATLKRQLADMKAHGALSPMPLPEPTEFRPTNMPTRMEPGYLTPAFFDVVREAAEESQRLGLRLWLYDEGGWPSGNACGQLVKAHPEYGRQSLRRSERPVAQGETVTSPDGCLAAFIVGPDGRYRRLAPGRSLTVEALGSRLVTFSIARHGWHADLLNPAATDAFIAMTHEGYRRAAGRHFGSTIPAIFTDEPNMGDMPWTEGMAEAFLRDKGYDLTDRLPSLYEGEQPEDAQVRVDYFDWWSERFARAFFGRCRDWCRSAGIRFSGHLNGEDETLGARKYGFGNAMRMMRQMDIPGVDAIWRQLWPGKRNHHFPKFASSVAHQEGLDWAITESFAVYGSGLSPEHMKWIVDYQFVRGINLLDMIGYPYSVSDWMVAGERPNYHPQNPLWDVLPAFHAYVARLSYALTLGKPRIRTALHFPIRDIWAGGKDAQAVADAHDRAAQTLLERQCDFDLLDDEAICAPTSRVEAGALRIGSMVYDTVVVTRQRWMQEAARRRLEEFARGGGRLIALDVDGDCILPEGARRISADDLPSVTVPLVRTTVPIPTLRVSARDTDTGTIYFVTNEGTDALDAEVTFAETAPCVRLDPETGRAVRIPISRVADGTRVRLKLSFAGSALLMFGKGLPRASAAEPQDGGIVAEIRGPWTLTPTRSFIVDADTIRITDTGLPAPVTANDPPPMTALSEAFSGDGIYTCRFTLTDEQARDAAWLDFGEVRYACRVELNGRTIGARLWQPWRWDVRGKLKPGVNALCVVVTNTLANQYIHNRAYERWSPAQLGPYHPRALEFEKDSLHAGLFGPIRVLRSDSQKR
ncbi:MAG: hypothetical protein GX446_02955 [Chthonomonadales bacterium]|nr:hypothetical protein [Chthonomonadales bacterium]